MGRRWYFVTLCTRDRKPLLREGQLVSAVLKNLEGARSFYKFDVYAYCFMPDHLHLLLSGLLEMCELPVFMRNFKGQSTVTARKLGTHSLWQKGFYDHVLRDGESENAIAWYIFENPVTKGLARRPHEWAFTGSWVFDWRKAASPPEKFVPPWKATMPR
jgi:putative transposase